MALRKATIVALLSVALVTEGAVAAAASSPSVARASTPAATTQPIPDGDGAIGTHTPGRPDTVAWESAADRGQVETFASATNIDVHKVDVVIATPSGMSRAAAARLIRKRDVDTLLSKVSSYWSAQSGGKVRFVRKTALKQIAVSKANCTSTSAIVRQVKAAGNQHYGSNWYTSSTRGPERREHLVVLYPFRKGDFPTSSGYGSTCGGTLGLGSVPAKASRNSPGGWSFNLFGGATGSQRSNRFTHYQYDKGVATLAHELGHNLGLRHSGLGWCDSKVADGRFRASGCGAIEGLDPLDLMGWDVAATGVPALSGALKRRLGVLPTYDQATVKASSGARTVRIAARHRKNSLRTLVNAVDPESGETYYVELRRPTTGHTFPYIGGLPWQAYTDYGIGYGVAVTRLAPGSSTWAYPGEHLIVPMGPVADRRSYMRVGETFTSRTGRLSIRVVKTSSTEATVRVTFPNP